MKKLLLIIALSLLVTLRTAAQEEKKYELYSVAFYNLENLFDTLHDAGKNDFEYLPTGTNRWGTMKYMNKLKNMSEVLAELSTDKLPMGPAVIGMSEIENRRVLEDLLKQPALKDRDYRIVHYDGPDRRGVECAFFYNPKLLEYRESKLIPYVYENNDTIHITRGFLILGGYISGEHFYFIVNHWPSRSAASWARELGGKQVRAVKDSLLAVDADAKIVIMGDMNDNPFDKSMSEALGAKRKAKKCGTHDLFNPWWDTLMEKGIGTLQYKGKWNLFDQLVFTGNLLGKERKTLKYYKNEIFMRDYLFQQEGKYKGYPKRTHAGGVWINGYSDHLPVLIYLIKEVQ